MNDRRSLLGVSLSCIYSREIDENRRSWTVSAVHGVSIGRQLYRAARCAGTTPQATTGER